MQPGIPARAVEIERVMRVLDGRDFQAAPDQNRDHLGDEGRLAGAAPAGKPYDTHRHEADEIPGSSSGLTPTAHPMIRIGQDFCDPCADLRPTLRPFPSDPCPTTLPMAEKTFDLRGLKCPLPVLR